MRLLVCSLVILVACTHPADDAHSLESQLLAPCCYRQSLADHDSPLASALRTELSLRLTAGEPAAHIIDDLVTRYGDHIRIAPPAGGTLGLLLAAILLAGAAALFWLARTRRSPPPTAARPALDPRYLDRLDDDLAEVDG